ncbi:hypothetical protein [Adlercreutzia shanghongiae]|uniref:Uncharacterized protein n=1 Tax=Adlercreutzia shanghongiae TaxID=3111773 RepID=A0ABU6IXG5_9ACTN|nr:hypothetical protein [Adlercreutzia sp. R22]MEC4294551.1 hypothetical protein [Adlercreutzia sp. R22]
MTRALHQMEEDGLVELGYRSVTVREPLYVRYAEWIETCNAFSSPAD